MPQGSPEQDPAQTPRTPGDPGLVNLLRAQVEELRLRLAEAEETIRAIREGEVDAFVVAGEGSGAIDRVYTLESAEHPYRRLVEAMHQAAITVAADGTVVYANRAFARAVQRPPELILGRPVQDLVAEASRTVVAEVLSRANGGRGEALLVRGDGTPLPVRMTASESADEGGTVCLVMTDLTDQRRLEEVVAAETLSRSILEQVVDAVVVGDPVGTLIRAGVAARRLCGREPVGLCFDEAFPLYRRGAGTALRFPLPLSRVIAGQTVHGLDVRLEDPADGRSFDLLLSVGPLRDPGGLVVGFVATLTDVTERHRAEEALQARERELQMVADNTPDILARFDRGLRHLFVNASVERATGRRRAEILGRTNRELGMPGSLCDLWEGALHSVFESGRPESIEFDYPGDDGVQHYSSRLVPEAGPDGLVATVLGVVHDVTDRKRYERALRDQDRRKDEFLATLAHELRNPLAAISNAVQIGRQVPDQEATWSWARDVITRQARQLAHLVDDLLDVSRINLGKIELRREVLDARPVLARAAEAVRPQVVAKRQTLELFTHASPLPVEADATRLEQIVVNLLGNASKYSDEGGRITLRAQPEGPDLRIRVEDTGIGLAPGDLQRIFEPFGQVEESLARSHGGLGIGLTLVRRLVELHGGEVAAESEGLGRGSTFTVRLPLSMHEISPVQPHGPAGKPAGARILVVDDNVDGAMGLTHLLRILGFDAESAYDGPAALKAAEQNPPAIALLDIGLPGMDGYELAAILRERHGPRMALYALSGYGRPEDRYRAEEAGFDGYLIKPVDPDDLLKLLASEVGR
ncbi:MAG: PAS domain S-box protein [Isosphaeraceae bacterium]